MFEIECSIKPINALSKRFDSNSVRSAMKLKVHLLSP